MNPPAEQLVRDYLNRVSVAARGKLGSAERREFLARMRESIERQTGAPGTADLIEVGKLLSGLGEPRALVERERARLAQLRGLPDSAAPRSAQLAARPAAWMPPFSIRRSAEVVVPSDAGQAPASEAPLGGEVRAQSRPITARRQPGEPMEPRPSGPHRPPWTVNGADHPGKDHPGKQRADIGAAEEPQSEPGRPAQETSQAEPGRPAQETSPGEPGRRAPQEPQDGPERQSQVQPAPERTRGEPGPPAEPERPGEPAPQGKPGRPGEPGRQSQGRQAPWAIRGERVRRSLRRSLRLGAEPERTGRMAKLRAGMAAAGSAGGSGRLAGARAGLGSIARATATLAGSHPLEACAIVLLGLGGLVYPPVWLVGALIALPSRDWDFRDKWVGLGGPVLLMIVGTGLLVVHAGHRDSVHLYVREAWMIADYLIRAGAVLGAAYLTWRTQRGPREPPVPPWNRPHRI